MKYFIIELPGATDTELVFPEPPDDGPPMATCVYDGKQLVWNFHRKRWEPVVAPKALEHLF